MDDMVQLALKKMKKFIIKCVLPWVIGILLFVVIIAGGFQLVIEKVKDVAGDVAKAASSTFKFDNKSDKPVITIDDELIEKIKEELENNAIDVDATYLTNRLLKKSLEAYYATQYPYIDGANYTEDTIKGCIYLKRGDNDSYMSYINYNSFKEKLGDNKTKVDVEDVKKYFSMDDDENIVIATWSKSENITASQDSTQNQSSVDGYSITEYKIDRAFTSQYSMSYRLPILLANLYSNEGFGIAVAQLGIDSKIELTVLDAITETVTTTTEYCKMEYKASGTYSWRNFEDDPLTTENFEDITWIKDYTEQAQQAYKVEIQSTVENNITVKPSLLDTWVVKGEVTDITAKSNTTTNTETTTMENDPENYTEDPNSTITEEQKEKIIKNILDSRDGDITKNSIEEINAKIYKKMTNHSKSTTTVTTETTYTSSDMELVDNTDKFLALIRANENGEYDKKGQLVEYIKKEKDENSGDNQSYNDAKSDIENEFLTSIDMLIDTLEKDKEISSYANTMKYIYYKYTDDEEYKTELDFSAFDTSEFSEVESSSTSGSSFKQFKKWLHSWEGGSATADGKFYIVESDGSENGSAVGHGVDIGTHGAELRAAGYNTSIGSKIPKDVVDAIEEKELNANITQAKSKTKGLNLKEYQIYALISRTYNMGATGAYSVREGKTFEQAYKAYWKQDRDDKYGKKGQVDYNHNFYTKYMHYVTTSDGQFLAGLENRRKDEWLLFQTGWFEGNSGAVREYCNTSSGDASDFLEVAKKCWVEVCTSGRYTSYGGSGIPAKGPAIDCSAYVSWVLYEYGYKDFKGGQTSSQLFYQTNWKNKYGWKEIKVGSGENPKDKLQPGDIFVRYGSGTHHVTIVESIKNGKLYAYDCGNSDNWLVKGRNGNSIDRSYFLTEQGDGKIIRVTAPK